jgi:hypothetical protein
LNFLADPAGHGSPERMAELRGNHVVTVLETRRSVVPVRRS